MWHPHSQDFIPFPQLLQSVGPVVQHLLINSCSDKESMCTIISSCPNIRNLSIHLPLSGNKGLHMELTRFLPVLGQGIPHLNHLTVAFLSIKTSDEFLSPPFLNLTHLDVLFPYPYISQERWEILTHLPKLTHICVGSVIQVDHILKVLLCPRLKILILKPYICVHNVDMGAFYNVGDNRLVLLQEEDYDSRILDWERGAMGGVDTWIFGELIVRARDSEYSVGFPFAYFSC